MLLKGIENAQKKNVQKKKQKAVSKNSAICKSEEYSQCAYERWVSDLIHDIDAAKKLLDCLRVVIERVNLVKKED